MYRNVARRMTPAQARAALRRAQSQRKQAIDKYNREVRTYNQKVRAHNTRRKQAVDKLNREIRSYNSRVRQHQQRRNAELNRLRASTTSSSRYVLSVWTVQRSFDRLDVLGAGDLLEHDLLDLSEGEAANSAATLNRLITRPAPSQTSETEIDVLKQTTITSELSDFSTDLDQRWRGAIFSLDPRNPDAARHFCTSAREMLGGLLEAAAPDDEVIEANPNFIRTPNGDVSRRARLHHCLAFTTTEVEQAFLDFVEDDIDNVIDLFDEFNSGAHGLAGKFGVEQLSALKVRVEDAIKFIYRIAVHAPES